MKRYLFKYQISLPTCFNYCSTELQFLTVAGMLSRDALPMDIGTKYFDGNSCLLQKAPQVFGRKIHHIRQFGKVYGMRTIITIIKADYCLMSQLFLNILSNVTLPPYPSFFVNFKHTFVTHPTKISRFSITVTPPPRDTACHPPLNSERAPSASYPKAVTLPQLNKNQVWINKLSEHFQMVFDATAKNDLAEDCDIPLLSTKLQFREIVCLCLEF